MRPGVLNASAMNADVELHCASYIRSSLRVTTGQTPFEFRPNLYSGRETEFVHTAELFNGREKQQDVVVV